jgi:hypothetical protein
VLFKCGRRIEIESKTADAPTITRSMHIALDNLKLEERMIVYPGKWRYTLAAGVEVVRLAELVTAMSQKVSERA